MEKVHNFRSFFANSGLTIMLNLSANQTPTDTPKLPTVTRTPTKSQKNMSGYGAPYDLTHQYDHTKVGGEFMFSWEWDGVLKSDEYYELRIWKPDGPHWGGAAPTKDKQVGVIMEGLLGYVPGVEASRPDLVDAERLCASVAVISIDPYKSLSPESESDCWNWGWWR